MGTTQPYPKTCSKSLRIAWRLWLLIETSLCVLSAETDHLPTEKATTRSSLTAALSYPLSRLAAPNSPLHSGFKEFATVHVCGLPAVAFYLNPGPAWTAAIASTKALGHDTLKPEFVAVLEQQSSIRKGLHLP